MIQINYTEVNFAERNFCSFDSQLSGTDHKTPILVGRVVLGIWEQPNFICFLWATPK